ncbi:MAG: hypothetical protein WBL31_02775, partial [Ilumatobacteraceae bacterium]
MHRSRETEQFLGPPRGRRHLSEYVEVDRRCRRERAETQTQIVDLFAAAPPAARRDVAEPGPRRRCTAGGVDDHA